MFSVFSVFSTTNSNLNTKTCVIKFLPILFSFLFFLFFKFLEIPEGAYLAFTDLYDGVYYIWLLSFFVSSVFFVFGFFVHQEKAKNALSFIQIVLFSFSSLLTFDFYSSEPFSPVFSLSEVQYSEVNTYETANGVQLIEIPEDLPKPYAQLTSKLPLSIENVTFVEVTTTQSIADYLQSSGVSERTLSFLDIDGLLIGGFLTESEPYKAYFVLGRELDSESLIVEYLSSYWPFKIVFEGVTSTKLLVICILSAISALVVSVLYFSFIILFPGSSTKDKGNKEDKEERWLTAWEYRLLRRGVSFYD